MPQDNRLIKGDRMMDEKLAVRLLDGDITEKQFCDIIGIPWRRGIRNSDSYNDAAIEWTFKAYRVKVDLGQIDPTVIYNITRRGPAPERGWGPDDLGFLDDEVLFFLREMGGWFVYKIFDLEKL